MVYIFYQRHWSLVIYHFSNIITKQVELIYAEPQNTKLANALDMKVSILDINQKNLIIKKQELPKELLILANSLESKLYQNININYNEHGRIFLFIPKGTSLIKIHFRIKPFRNSTRYIFILWLIGLALVFLITSFLFAKNQIKSILLLANVLDKYRKGENVFSYKPSGAYEIRLAGQAFLKMLTKIEGQIEKRIKMLAMVSHDLKTPITRMKIQLAILPKDKNHEDLLQDLDQMEKMVGYYLDYIRGDGDEQSIVVEINQWLNSYLQQYKGNLQLKKNIKVNKMFTRIKPNSLMRALNNIIDNAEKYSEICEIQTYAHMDEVVIDISDNGIGIEASKRVVVFKPFYKEDSARTLNSMPSVGLGLSIAQEIISGHYGSISIHASHLGGALIKISLPILKGIQ